MTDSAISAALEDIHRRLRRAEVPEATFVVPAAAALTTEIERRAYLGTRAAKDWLSAPVEGEARGWAPVILEAFWSGPANSAAAPLQSWLRSAIGAYLTKEQFPDVFVPVRSVSSVRGLGAFRLAQVAGSLARCFGDDALVRCAAGTVSPEATFGAEAIAALSVVDPETLGVGPEDPSLFAAALYGPTDGSGRTLAASVDAEVVMLTQALEYTCLEVQADGSVRRELPYASCSFDFTAYRLTAVTHERTQPRFAALPPDYCRARVAAGETRFDAAINGGSRSDVFKLAKQLVGVL